MRNNDVLLSNFLLIYKKKIFEFNLYEHAQVIYTERKSSPLINDDVCRKI